jgi:hypothetical protein
VTNPQDKPFEYWVNVYERHIDMGGSMREEAEEHAEVVVSDGYRRVDCRLLRYTPGKGVRDVTPKQKRPRNVSPDVRAAASARMKRLLAEGRVGRKKPEAAVPESAE